MTLFILGVAISVPISILSPFATTWIQKAAAKRSSKQALARKTALEAELLRVKELHDDRSATLIYIGTRLMVINTTWLIQVGIDYVFGLFNNMSQTFAVINNNAQISVNKITTISNTVGSLVAIVIISLIMRYGLVGFRLARKIANFAAYKAAVEAEIAAIEARLATTAATSPAP